VPILIALATYADVRATTPHLSLRDFVDRRMIERGGEALRQAAAVALQAGDAIVLFDGIDEIPEQTARIAVVRSAEQFFADHRHARCIVTSRPYGYIRLAGPIEHLTLGNFSDDQVSEFVHKWQRAFENWRRPKAPDLDVAKAEAEGMVEEIGKHGKVAELARNPLMLVIIALIRYEGRRLPEKRVQLYERAVKTLMDTWNRWRSDPQISVGGLELPYEKLVQVWARVAEWTRREKLTGVVHREELRRRLIETLQDLEFDEDDPGATADSYLNAAVEKAGLLEERGQNIFAFWHPTFEEFLAAVELTKMPSKLLSVRDDPRWHEVILLALGLIGVIKHDQEAATALLDQITHEAPTPLEPLFRPLAPRFRMHC
jgi:predicted NACHT family NTPase